MKNIFIIIVDVILNININKNIVGFFLYNVIWKNLIFVGNVNEKIYYYVVWYGLELVGNGWVV